MPERESAVNYFLIAVFFCIVLVLWAALDELADLRRKRPSLTGHYDNAAHACRYVISALLLAFIAMLAGLIWIIIE